MSQSWLRSRPLNAGGFRTRQGQRGGLAVDDSKQAEQRQHKITAVAPEVLG